MIKNIIWFFLINALALYFVVYFLGKDSIIVSSQAFNPYLGYLCIGGVLGILNAVVRPILSLIALPFFFLTFGFSLAIINAFLLWCTEILFTDILPTLGIGFEITGGMLTYIIAALFLSLINSVLHFFGK